MWWDVIKVENPKHLQPQKTGQFPGQETIEVEEKPLLQVAQPQTTPTTQQTPATTLPLQVSQQTLPTGTPVPLTSSQQQKQKPSPYPLRPTSETKELPLEGPELTAAMQPTQIDVQPTVGTTAARTQADASDIAETDPSQFTQQTRQSMMRTASGQHSDLSTQIANISASARTNPTEQKKLLGRIRNLLREANIPETKVATGLPGDIQ